MQFNCPGNLKSLDFFSSQYWRMLDKISFNFKEVFIPWRLVSEEFLCSGKE